MMFFSKKPKTQLFSKLLETIIFVIYHILKASQPRIKGETLHSVLTILIVAKRKQKESSLKIQLLLSIDITSYYVFYYSLPSNGSL